MGAFINMSKQANGVLADLMKSSLPFDHDDPCRTKSEMVGSWASGDALA
ncbi:MAG: hypothetical protein Q7T00_04935 [Rugosibacter sp.]|jgi:hypothetical protein|nr:hypothetical protein [Rugosibacter sp.]